MRYAVFTVSTPDWTPEETVVQLSEAGYEGVEWRVTDQGPSADGRPGFWSGNRSTWPLTGIVEAAPRLRELTRSAGLEVCNLGTYVRCDDPEAVEQAMRGAAICGAPSLRVNVPGYDGSEPYLPLRDRARAQYREVEALARQYGVRALVEIHMGSIVPSASAAAAFLQGMDPQWVGVIHDAGNMVYEGYENYRLGLETLGPYLAHVHLKSAAWERTGERQDGSAVWQCRFAPLRSGIVDLEKLFQALLAVDYDGWISFEDFSTEQPTAERVRDSARTRCASWPPAPRARRPTGAPSRAPSRSVSDVDATPARPRAVHCYVPMSRVPGHDHVMRKAL